MNKVDGDLPQSLLQHEVPLPCVCRHCLGVTSTLALLTFLPPEHLSFSHSCIRALPSSHGLSRLTLTHAGDQCWHLCLLCSERLGSRSHTQHLAPHLDRGGDQRMVASINCSFSSSCSSERISRCIGRCISSRSSGSSLGRCSGSSSSSSRYAIIIRGSISSISRRGSSSSSSICRCTVSSSRCPRTHSQGKHMHTVLVKTLSQFMSFCLEVSDASGPWRAPGTDQDDLWCLKCGEG